MTQPGNVVDLGVLAPDGFRGWSGSARQSFVLTPGWATPGYLPGPLAAGRWHVLLGLYRLAPAGCDVRIEIRWTLAEPGVASAAPPLSWDSLFERVTRHEAGWYRGDLHSHSHHSEAQGALHDLLAAAQAQGLDFLAITEHNTVSHLVDMAGWPEPPSPLVIPAMELTTYHGHANALGIRRWHDFRRCTPEQMAALRAEVQAEGALFVVNHPKVTGPPWEWGSEAQADAIEVWQHPWHVFNYQSLAAWDRLLKHGCRIAAVGGSDKHQAPFDGSLGFHEVGQPCTWVYAEELSVPASAGRPARRPCLYLCRPGRPPPGPDGRGCRQHGHDGRYAPAPGRPGGASLLPGDRRRWPPPPAGLGRRRAPDPHRRRRLEPRMAGNRRRRLLAR